MSSKKKIVYKRYFDWELEVVEIDVNAKIVDHRRLGSCFWTDYDPIKHDPLIKKHNEALKEYQKAADKMSEIQNKL